MKIDVDRVIRNDRLSTFSLRLRPGYRTTAGCQRKVRKKFEEARDESTSRRYSKS
jgi:hypothetical protein